MKAFSFLTILESLSKKLSILRTKMHSNNLRVDYESITSQLRVSGSFSNCASRRASRYAAILTILFTVGVGSVWGADYVIYQATSDGVNTSDVEKTEISFVFNKMKGVTNSPVISVKSDTYGIEAGLKAPRFGGSSNGNNIKFVVKNGYTATVTAYVQTNSEKKNIAIQTTEGTPNNTDIAYVSCEKKGVVYKIEATNLSAGEYYIKASHDAIGVIKLIATVIASSGGGEETKHTVSFDTHGGGNVDDITQSSAGAAITLPAAPTKTGYTFAGWYTAETDGTKAGNANAPYTPTATITLHAQWTANKYDVTHTLSNATRSSGGEAGDDKATYNTEYSVVFAATSGYILPENITVQVGSTTLTTGTDYTWNKSTGTLTINANKVTGNITITVNAAQDPVNPMDNLVLISSDYTFTPTAALTANTLYEENRFISFGEGNKFDNGIQLKTNRQLAFKVAAGAQIKVTFNAKDSRKLQIGTTSAGTDLANSASSPVTATRTTAGIVYLSASSDLYASEIEITFPQSTTYTLTNAVNTNGYGTVSPTSVYGIPSGTATNSNSNTYTVNGTTVTATPAESTAQYTYAFSSWSGLPATVTADATVTANFTRTVNKYTITWKNADGTVLKTDNNVEYGATPAYNGATPTKDADAENTYTFSGWSPAISAVTGNATYTATFTATPIETPEPEAVPRVGTFTGAGTNGTVNLYWTMPTKPVTTRVDIASATLSTAVGQSEGATSTITKVNTNEIKVEYSTDGGWKATGVQIPLATSQTNVESITFEYKSASNQSVDLIPFLYDGTTRWVESGFAKLTPTEWTSHTSVITQEAWKSSNIYSKDKTIQSVNFYANPATATNGTFYIRNVVLNQGTQVAASGLIIVRKVDSNPTSPTDGTEVYDGNGIAATCTDNGLENGTTYHYAAYAHDGQGNYSEPLYWQYTYREGVNTYAPDDTDFPNPERGFYEQVQWNASKGYDAVIGDSYFNAARAASRSLILRIYYMDSETLRKNDQLPEDFITMFNADMEKFRTNGMKCILRFAYDENSGDGAHDASPATWATHLAQLKPHLEANADVIYVVQAGFLGVWGEWYYSSLGTGNDEISEEIKNNLIDQLLAAVPANRCVQLRTPLFKKEYLGNNNPLTSGTAYKGTAQARLGHHNDAFLNGAANQGTYEDRETDMAYIAQECLFVPIGGETNLEESQVAELYKTYCEGTVAEAEMAQLHYSYLNYSYSTVVTNRWKAEGSYARMSKQLGYRFELESATLPNGATAGTPMNVQLNIKNVGYAPLYNERHAYIVFKNNTNTYSIKLSSDPRTWAPNSAVTLINENIALPANMVAGTYDMYLHLPDVSANIANNPKYAVRFANQGIWESETGYNKLNKQVVVTATALPTYTITYNLNGGTGTEPTEQTAVEGQSITLATATGLSKAGHTFAGWSDGTNTYEAGTTYTMPASNVTLTAQWREIAQTYTITYNVNRPTKHDDAEAETDFPAQTTVTVNAGGTITLPNPSIIIDTNPVYTAKWKDASDNEYNGGAEITPTGDMTLTAQWTPQSWPIRYYESFDGTNLGTEITGLTPNQYTYGVETEFCKDKEAIVQNANKTGYTWLGWWSRWSHDAPNPITKADAGYSGEFSLFAKWEEESVTPDPDPECETTTITYTLVTPNNNTATQNVSGTDKITTLTGATAKGTATANTGVINNLFSDYSVRYGASSGSDNTDNGVTFTFDVPTGYVFKPSAITSELMCYGVGGNGDNHYYQFVGELSSENGQIISGNVYPSNSDGASAAIVYTINDVQMTGTVTLRLNAVKVGGSNQSFRIKSPITIVGDLCSVDCSTAPEATITWNTQPADGQVGSADFAYAVSCSDGSAVTVTSADPSIATIVDGKLHYVAAGTTHLVATATDACGNEITQNSNDFTVTAASVDPTPGTGTCVTIFEAKATSKTAFSATTGTITSSNLSEGNELNKDGYSYAVKPNSSNALKIAPKTGETFKVGDKLTFVVYTANDKEIGFKIGGNTYTQSVNKSLYYFEQELTETDITDGATTITFNRNSADDRWVAVKIERCAQLPSCTTPVLEDLSAQTKCPGSNVSWTAIVNNTATLQENGETIAYQWNKKGNNTVLSNTATLTLNDITEAAGGTYVVTATVSANGKASATATKEVTLTVTPATATPTITASASTVYAGNPVTLKATCASSGVTYQWYKCTDAEGTTAQIINDEENATLALTAGDAGTHYYKVIVTGDGTHSCGDAEKVYELVVSSAIDASDCTTYFWFPYAQDATTNGVTNNENKFFGNSPRTGDNNSGTYEFELDDITYTATRNTGASEFTISFTVPENSIGTMAINCKGSSSKPLYLKHTDNTEILVSNSSSIKSFVIENITPGSWTLQSSGSWTLSGMAVKVCSGNTCTDPQVTATVDNATVCEGTKNVTFTATNYADGAEFQWQKKDGNTWKDINEATSATYTISSVAENAGKYRVIATQNCSRISEEVTLTVLTAPTFNTFATTASVMKGNALAISDVQATGATGYAWYKSADNSLDVAADTKVGTSKDLLLAAASIPEAADQTFYLFCVASNSCGSVTSNAITVTVTPFVEEECATAGNETNDHEFDFKNTKCSEATLDAKKVWSTNANDKYLTYTAKNGRYFKTAKVQVAHSSKTIAAYAYITNGTDWTAVELTGLTTSLTTKEITFPENENVTGFRIGRKFDDKGEGSGNFYLYEACFTYENACTETTLTVGSYNNEYNITDGGEFTEPTFTLKSGETTLEGQTLTYTSSNTAVATVDEDGNVTFEGMTGTVTITVAFAGATIDKTEYCACKATYTITVYCTDRAPEIVAAAGTNLNGCNNSITLEAKMEGGTTSFTEGTFQWYRDGEAIEGATSASYEVVRAGTYTVSRTHTCTTMSSNSAVVTNDNVEPKVERLTPFQYYHVNKDYSNQMKNRHLFAVTSYGTYEGKRYHLTATRNGEALNLSSSTAFFTIPSSDNAVDTVMINLNELKNKYAEGDEIVITCAPINSCNTASAITASITIHVIGDKPTLALICSGANGDGTRDTKELVVGGDFLTGYNKADLCKQTSNTTFDPNIEWGFYTELKKNYIVVPVNGYAEFNKLNYEPFDILLLTDYPKSSKSEAAQKVIDDMAELCDYRPLLSFKTHFQSDKWKDANGQYKYTKWVKKGFTTAPVVPAQTATYVNIVCYAHPMFDNIDEDDTGEHSNYTFHDADDPNQLVYHMLSEGGYESVKEVKKGIQGFELAAADNFVTIGLIHNDAKAATEEHAGHTHVKWTIGENDRQLVALAERQANIEARMMLFSLNAGAQSLQTEGGRLVILKCLEYLLQTDPLQVADCRFTFDNGEGAQGSEKWENGVKPHDYEGTGYQGDGLWSTAANWGPDYNVVPGRNNDVRIAAPCTVDAVKTKLQQGEVEQISDAYFPEVLSIHITKDGSLTIPANSSLTARSTILRADEDGNVYPTNVEDISLGSDEYGNSSLILNNERGDTKAGVAMYSTAKADIVNYSAAASTWQYIGTPHSDVKNAAKNYYDSWLYQYDTETQGWAVIQNGGPLDPFRGYCVTHPKSPHTYWMEGTLVSTTNQDITIPANKFVVVANSWTAPIQIHELTDDDMEGLTDKTIYFFNTGSDPNAEGSIKEDATDDARWAAGTYISVPINAAEHTGGDTNIPSMQGFYVVGGNTDGTLHLDYERHVRAKRKNLPSGPMHAPARRVAADDEPQVAKFLFRGTRYDDRLIILERPDFTRGYDSGWDGEQWGGNAAAPMSYVVTETRWDAVSAIPEYEGTVIAFRAGEDSEYTIHFDYDGMEDALYLLDTDTQIYTRVLKGNSYTFTCTDKAEHNRFILTRKAPQIATGTEHINTGENAKAVKFIKDDKIFIFVNGMLYDATGKMVIR